MCLFKYPNSAVFWYDFRYRGQRYRSSTHTTDRVLAGRVERARRKALEEGLNGLKPVQKPKRVGELYLELVERKKSRWAERTTRLAKHSWGHLQKMFGAKFAHDITSSDIARYQEARIHAKTSPTSVNREMTLLRQLLHGVGVWHTIRQDYKALPVEEQSGAALTTAEENGLLTASQQSHSLCVRLAVLMALSTGMRYSELRFLRWRQVDLNGDYLIVGRSKTKTGTGRRILLPPRAIVALREWAERFPNREGQHFVFCHERYGMKNHLLTAHMVYDIDPTRPMLSFNGAWRNIRKKAGLKIRFHDLRHTAVTRLLEGGTPFNTVALMMGWSPSNMVLMIRKYGHLIDKSWKAAVILLDGSSTNAEKCAAEPTNSGAAAPPPKTGDSREEEPVQNDAAAGDPSSKKGGSSQAA